MHRGGKRDRATIVPHLRQVPGGPADRSDLDFLRTNGPGALMERSRTWQPRKARLDQLPAHNTGIPGSDPHSDDRTACTCTPFAAAAVTRRSIRVAPAH